MNNIYGEYALIFKALSDSTRLEILEMIKDKELCACHILKKFNITQPTLSYHMKILKDVGLINCKKNGSWMHYSLNEKTIIELESFFRSLKK